MTNRSAIPIDVAHLLPQLNQQLLELLHSLSKEEWNQPTVARQWTVKDVAAHLLDGNIRVLSIFRDDHWGESAAIHSKQDLIDFLNQLNADWVKAMKRVSPQMLITLHELTGKLFCDHLQSLDPFEKSVLAVDWAGETESRNWMEIARQYTEKWLHQQQIRDAVNKPGLMTKEYFYPFIDIFMLALPYTYRDVNAKNGTVIRINIPTEIGGDWFLLRKENKWQLNKEHIAGITAEITIPPEISWKLFSKSLRPDEVRDKVRMSGDASLAETALHMISVMA